jgi:hypothetical protein
MQAMKLTTKMERRIIKTLLDKTSTDQICNILNSLVNRQIKREKRIINNTLNSNDIKNGYSLENYPWLIN